MSATPSSRGPVTDGPRDPELHTDATYALDLAYVARLTARIPSSSGRTVEHVSPLGGQPLGAIPQSEVVDVERAFARARAAQRAWELVPVAERQEILLRLHDVVLERREEICELICLESGKARKDAFLEVAHLAMTARYYGRTAAQHLATTRVPGMFPVLTHVEVNRIPKGVVGIISPWNYPFTLALCDGIPALAAGNAVVAKPDQQTILTGLLGAELMDQAGFPADLWQVVSGAGADVGTPMIAAADYICFTGSTRTGKLIASQCAERLIGCSLELGGKNPMLVLRDASVERAAEGAVRGAFSNSGQLCISMERIFVADQVYDRFVERFVARTEAMTLGASTSWEVDVGTLISQAQLDTVEAHVADAVAKGATVLTGGKARPDLGPYYYEPTVLEGVTPDMTCFGTETFGPLVSLYRFHDESEAVERANDGTYGLNASIYSRDHQRARATARRVKAGTVNVNEPYGAAFGSLAAPMGGMRESGLGRRQGAEGILRYTETQSVGTQRGPAIAPPFGISEERYAAIMTSSLKVLKKLGRA
ncbi:succinic semialdehyde dehydrogenase [Nocardioides jishulii]|uniref:Succinate-semialdehyde dehydrogenase (NADP(+)) n=1 Tax=Nocardioides jishulii TaxID=2575440 RepID=A0A4U2YTK3_9ACTN|nr:succinic semialdehyde dehydrogenase [Nocardioides jishulii]QCX28348.1 succinate-semialdehyde dehydrogenase (NADP(+)) [Nocardioides jishulii]TKI64759.1 succinate-semialdehyde dehydrogenase (NADP(+)) [Nocardioides jishulii]